jgi:putative aldouronate transport system permease protein
MLIVNIWKGAGYSAIVYLAAISGIDMTFYEAAEIDGANRFQQTWYVTLPLLRPTVIILTIMAVGRIMNADFGLFFNVTRDIPNLYPTVEVIDTYIYRALKKMGDIGISSATGFFQSVVSFVLVLLSNKLADKIEEGSALF